MGWRGLIVVVAVGLVAAACSDSTEGSPATAPPTVSTQATPSTVTPSTVPSTTLPTTTVPPTTVDRVAEIEAIFRDLEFRRLDALYRGDEEAFRALFANEGYLEESLEALDIDFGFVGEPTADSVSVIVDEIVIDRDDCIAANLMVDFSAALVDGSVVEILSVLTPTDTGGFGFAYGGDGWLCDGPHPLEK